MTATVPATEPYPWPWDGLRPSALALVLVGWDAHWAARCPDPGPSAVGASVARLAPAVVAAGGDVAAVVHTVPARSAPEHPAPTPLALPAPLEGATDHVVRSAGVDGFYGSHLDVWLRARGRTQLLVVGHGLEGPVHSTLRTANDQGLECLLVVDACAPLDPALVAGATSSVCMSGGIFGAVGAVADVLAALAPLAPTLAPPTPLEDLP